LAIGQQRKHRNINPAIIFVTCCWGAYWQNMTISAGLEKKRGGGGGGGGWSGYFEKKKKKKKK
jgi:hypothetical protein